MIAANSNPRPSVFLCFLTYFFNVFMFVSITQENIQAISLLIYFTLYNRVMFLEQLIYGLADVLLQVPPVYYLVLFLLIAVGVVIISLIFKFHLRKYTFRDYKTGLMRMVYISGLGILMVIALILLALIFGLS